MFKNICKSIPLNAIPLNESLLIYSCESGESVDASLQGDGLWWC